MESYGWYIPFGLTMVFPAAAVIIIAVSGKRNTPRSESDRGEAEEATAEEAKEGVTQSN
jgi:hypothetical protein